MTAPARTRPARPSRSRSRTARTHGTASVNLDGTIDYVPAADYFGADELTYQICDDGTTDGADD